MQILFFRVSLLLLLTIGVVLGAQFWEGKPYFEWSPKEVEKVLNRSPWAQTIVIKFLGNRPGMKSSRRKNAQRSGGAFGRPGGGTQAGRGGFGNNGGGGYGGGGSRRPNARMGGRVEDRGGFGGPPGEFGGAMGMPSMTAVVRWFSAKPIKEAAVKLRYGNEAKSAAGGLRYLQRAEENYVISVVGLPKYMRGVAEGSPEKVKQKTSLRRNGKQPIFAGDLEVTNEEETIDLYFSFSRDALIILEDKEVEFLMRTEALEVRKKFKLKKMLYKGELSL